MVNFRYHIISLIAVFLALAVGVVMGSAVIDKAVVETLEDQQNDISTRVDEVIAENDALLATVAEMQQRSQRLSDEAGHLIAGSLENVPVVVLAMRGVPSEQVDDLEALLASAGVDAEGTLWFTERLALFDQEQRRDLARVLGRSENLAPDVLRDIAVDEVTDALVDPEGAPPPPEETSTENGGGSEPVVPPVGETPAPDPAPSALVELREAGFIDFEAPQGDETAITALGTSGTRAVLVTGAGSQLGLTQWVRPLVEALVGQPPGPPRLPLLVVDAHPDEPEEAGFTGALRADDTLSARLSTVSRIDDFAGQLATVLALQDLGEGQVGHYGRDAQRLIPAPAG
ncbi:MAG TPA: copper transporter [Acidimicrobiales bacterium]|nr:copper transporter [Acidimicrobiales bacterium]